MLFYRKVMSIINDFESKAHIPGKPLFDSRETNTAVSLMEFIVSDADRPAQL